MRHKASKLGRILAFGLLLPALAFAAPSSSRLPTPAKPAPTDRNGDASAADMKCTKGADGVSTCAAQHESFERAAQAASYLGIYMSQYSAFAQSVVSDPSKLKKLQDSVVACLQGTGKCGPDEKSYLTAAMIQYNLGKEVKSMMLKNNTNQANMESFKTPDGKLLFEGKLRHVRNTQRTYKETFKLQPKDFNTVESFHRGAVADGERQSLGEEFKQDYLKFIDTYTQTTQDHAYWHRAYTKPTGSATAHAVWDIDPNTNNPKMHSEQFMFDVATQGNDKVRKIVADAKDSIEAPEIEAIKDKPGMAKFKKDPADSMRFREFGLGVPVTGAVKVGDKVHLTEDETLIARGIANEINDRIAKREAEDKKDKGVGYVNVQLGVEQFDHYLEQVWPKTGYKYKIPSQEK